MMPGTPPAVTREEIWAPSAGRQQLVARAKLLQAIRSFFAGREVLEVETPLLMRTTATDPFLTSLEVPLPGGQNWYLQTSPEYAMKRLLAAGSGPVYQLCKAFRQGEAGRLHNPEFSLLEWYRPGFTLRRLLGEVADLVHLAEQTLGVSSPGEPYEVLDYGELFARHLNLNPHFAEYAALQAAVQEQVGAHLVPEHAESPGRSLCLDILFSHAVQPKLQSKVFVVDYPACQAALARQQRRPDGVTVAKRFELFMRGVELANAYEELTDADEQLARMQKDEASRQLLGASPVKKDMRLLAALKSGMPDTSGVALGIDRLLLLLTGGQQLADLLAFPERLA